MAETEAARSNLAHKFVGYLEDMKSALERQHFEAKAVLPFRIAGLLTADRQCVWRLLVDKWFAQSKEKMSNEIVRYSQLKVAGADTDVLLGGVNNFVTAYIFEHQPFVSHVSEMTTRFERAKEEASAIESGARQEAGVVKTRLLSEIAATIDDMQNKIVAKLQSWKSSINSALDRMREEGRPVGIEIAGAGVGTVDKGEGEFIRTEYQVTTQSAADFRQVMKEEMAMRKA